MKRPCPGSFEIRRSSFGCAVEAGSWSWVHGGVRLNQGGSGLDEEYRAAPTPPIINKS